VAVVCDRLDLSSVKDEERRALHRLDVAVRYGGGDGDIFV
jgi:hypothetical protein